MTAQIITKLIGPHYHGQCIPAHDAADIPFHEHVAGHPGFFVYGDGITVGSGK